MEATGIDIASVARAVESAASGTRIVRAYLFGSRARGESRPDSDVDILVEAERGFSLIDAARFRRLVSDELGAEVDVVSGGSLSGAFGERVRRERVQVHGRA